MLPPVYDLLRAAPAVVQIVGDDLADHGEIPQNTSRPYITWFTVVGDPQNQLSGTPCADFDLVQIDMWANDRKTIKNLAIAVRNALDEAGHLNTLIIDTREPVGTSRMFRMALQANFITQRDPAAP